MNGADYVANTKLTRRKPGGGWETLAEVGERCGRVPESSLGWLAEDGLISLAPVAPAAKGKKPAAGGGKE